MQHNPFRIPLKPQWFARALEKLLSLNVLATCYDLRPHENAPTDLKAVNRFLDHTLGSLDVSVEFTNAQEIEKIPSSGPIVFVANHPFGGVEGVAMTRHLLDIRPDLKVLTNELLARIPEFQNVFIGVDVLSENATQKNMRGMRGAIKHLKNGGALLVFPAGMVSAIDTKDFQIRDRTWNTVVAKLMRQFSAACVPFYIHGRNSKAFYFAGLIHKRLRTLMLPRELVNKQGQKLQITVGEPIQWKDVQSLGDEEQITQYLRTATDLLKYRNETALVAHQPLEEVAAEERVKQLASIEANLHQLQNYLLLSYREFDVYCAPFETLPNIMPEIAKSREKTFRAAGEGTGDEQDSDRFDPHYLHLFVWDRENQRIVGGYRLGKVDEIIKKFGVDGLYSRTLYRFNERYISKMDGALEMGRSFVSTEYQRHPRALDLLWKGIGSWVVNNPQYHTLFGCVSISREHSDRAREFLNESLMENFRAEQEMLTDVEPVAPLKIKNRVWSRELLSSLKDIAVINKLLGQCDPGKSVPVLLRQYLALNGRFIGFSVNHSFNDSLDGLIMVDLRKTPLKYLQRYLGKEESKNFMNKWQEKSNKEQQYAA